ncbi:MAG: flagellar biosynthetic protein FlhF [Clostridia bacterium]|jgi:flagellar biosynthesis protein FlhF|nr:flagellar biosynthetic protein FlhF [Clostridia bacterium]
MKVKRYVGETAQEAMQKVRSDLGRDAIILNTRKIRRKGLAGVFSKPLIEVVATIDSDFSNKASKQAAPPVVKPTPQHFEEEQEIPSFINELNANLKQNVQNIPKSNQYMANAYNPAVEEKVEMKPEQPLKKPAISIDEITEVELGENFSPDQIGEIKNMLTKVYDAVKVDYESSKLSDVTKLYLEKLEKNEVDKAIINDLKEDIIERLSYEEQKDEKVVKNTIYTILDGYIKDPQPYNNNQNKKVVVFIGPTGVGKTTTLAKLAANMVLNEKKKVGLITSDTYRIAAVEQLKTYSEIIGVPLSIIYSPAEIFNAVQNYDDKEIILLDTAGRSHKDQYQLMELKSLLKSSIDYETYLVLSATTKSSDCMEIIKSYGFLDDYKLLFTKLDETSSLGVLLNIAYITKRPIAYLTTGQSVPDDIEIADKSKIIHILMGDN